MNRNSLFRPRARRVHGLLSGFVLSLLALPLLGCLSFLRKADVPMYAERVPADSEASCAVVLLPGRLGSHADFLEAGFDQAVTERGLDIQVVAADAHVGYYRDRTFVERLHDDVVAPLLEEGKRVWLVGTSMGGIGTLIYTRQYPDDPSGLIAIAPFLGKKKLVEEIVAAGGPLAWSPSTPPAPDTIEGLWLWIAAAYAEGPPLPTYLAFGEEDRVRHGTRLFAPLLPPENVLTQSGGHDWKVWSRLWDEMLDRGWVCSKTDA